MAEKIGFYQSQWKKGRIAYEIAKLMAERDRMYEDELVQSVMHTWPGEPDYNESVKIVRRAIEKLREGDKNDPDIMLIYADHEKVETDKIDPLTKKKIIYKRKFYFNAKIYEDLANKIDQMIATGHGFIRRAIRNEDILKTLGWDQRKIDLLKVLDTYQQTREKFKPIVTQEPEQRAEEIMQVVGGQVPKSIPGEVKNGRWICPRCGEEKSILDRTKHWMIHIRDNASDQALLEQENAKQELDSVETKLYDSFAALADKQQTENTEK